MLTPRHWTRWGHANRAGIARTLLDKGYVDQALELETTSVLPAQHAEDAIYQQGYYQGMLEGLEAILPASWHAGESLSLRLSALVEEWWQYRQRYGSLV